MRNTKTIEIESEGRDKGKTFLVTEMPASKLERWSARALVAVLGGNVPADIQMAAKVSSAAAFASVLNKVLSGLQWDALEPLYSEMLDCIAYVPDPSKKATVQLKVSNVDNFIEEVPTLLKLRLAVLEVNFGFFDFVPGLFSHLRQAGILQD